MIRKSSSQILHSEVLLHTIVLIFVALCFPYYEAERDETESIHTINIMAEEESKVDGAEEEVATSSHSAAKRLNSAHSGMESSVFK